MQKNSGKREKITKNPTFAAVMGAIAGALVTIVFSLFVSNIVYHDAVTYNNISSYIKAELVNPGLVDESILEKDNPFEQIEMIRDTMFEDALSYSALEDTTKSLLIEVGVDEANVQNMDVSQLAMSLLMVNRGIRNHYPEKKALGNVFLTGATGFLGAHVLDALMQQESGRIYCLVRSMEREDRRGRLSEILNYYFGGKYEHEIGKRIIPVVGDIETKGLSSELPEDVQTVIHTAATVKHYGAKAYFQTVNVEGTRNVTEYALSVGAKLIHVSTISVSGNSLADGFDLSQAAEELHFDETCFYLGQPLSNVYVRSKFDAERVVLDAILEKGLDAKIVRVGNLTNRYSDLKFQPNYESNAFLKRVKAFLSLGVFPETLLPLYTEFSPVDETADGIVKIAEYAEEQNVFHLYSNKPLYFETFLALLRKLKIPMDVVSEKDFVKAAKAARQSSGKEFIYETLQNDLDAARKLQYESNIHVENDFTVRFLKQTGFSWSEIDGRYIREYIEYFRRLGYWEEL